MVAEVEPRERALKVHLQGLHVALLRRVRLAEHGAGSYGPEVRPRHGVVRVKQDGLRVGVLLGVRAPVVAARAVVAEVDPCPGGLRVPGERPLRFRKVCRPHDLVGHEAQRQDVGGVERVAAAVAVPPNEVDDKKLDRRPQHDFVLGLVLGERLDALEHAPVVLRILDDDDGARPKLPTILRVVHRVPIPCERRHPAADRHVARSQSTTAMIPLPAVEAIRPA
mmetsp:Transcript_109549/g.316732  ORF Transcript_109549/g.316732 Transcript_109549/m.316732 type:complete len:223 (+) Transcript_109549:618-1286(+)